MDDSPSSSSPRPRIPSAWADELVEVFERSITVEYASLTRDGRPVTVPMTPYLGADGRTIDVSTGLTYPAKAERARRDPRVCLLFADPVGSGLERPTRRPRPGPRHGARLRPPGEHRPLRPAQHGEAARGHQGPTAVHSPPPGLVLRAYLDRGDSAAHAVVGAAKPRRTGAHVERPRGDRGAALGSRSERTDNPAPGWLPLRRGGPRPTTPAASSTQDLTTVDANGFPLCLPVQHDRARRRRLAAHPRSAAPRRSRPGRRVSPCMRIPRRSPARRTGRSSGPSEAPADGGGKVRFRAERALADWSLAGGRPRIALSFLATGRRLAPRLASEAQRRFQPVPTVRLPDRP